MGLRLRVKIKFQIKTLPNVGLLKAPYIWLPGFTVPVVLFGHAIAIFQVTKTIFRNSTRKSV